MSLPPNLAPVFPGLSDTNCIVTSPRDAPYNCIAWAADVTDRWWEPCHPDAYWPEGVEMSLKVESFIAAFESIGFETCANGTAEGGFTKVAVYVGKDEEVTHMARSLPDGKWTSKLGKLEDISHETPEAVGGDPGYGVIVRFLRRPI